ncbi:hypothetical protein, partial [Anaerophaga thermohalophila]|uniref:hypothetical protein n=1 Tax=Anaerophaga thermohalophila TaxID=177400 RepID=UPI001B7FDDFF
MKNQYLPLSLHPSNSPKGENQTNPQSTINLTIRLWQFKRNRALDVPPLGGQGVCDGKDNT